jgi:hypothetical protein
MRKRSLTNHPGPLRAVIANTQIPYAFTLLPTRTETPITVLKLSHRSPVMGQESLSRLKEVMLSDP